MILLGIIFLPIWALDGSDYDANRLDASKPNFHADELLKLHQLKELGALTEEEFEQQKNKLI